VLSTFNAQSTLEQLRFRNRQQRGIKPRFGSVLPKNRGFGTDFDNRNNTAWLFSGWPVTQPACKVLLQQLAKDYFSELAWSGITPEK